MDIRLLPILPLFFLEILELTKSPAPIAATTLGFYLSLKFRLCESSNMLSVNLLRNGRKSVYEPIGTMPATGFIPEVEVREKEFINQTTKSTYMASESLIIQSGPQNPLLFCQKDYCHPIKKLPVRAFKERLRSRALEAGE
jgi:hypothetical protein